MTSQTGKNILLWLIILVMVLCAFQLVNATNERRSTITYSEFQERVDRGDVKKVTIRGNHVTGTSATIVGQFHTYTPQDPTLVQRLQEHGVQIEAKPEDQTSSYVMMTLSWLVPIGILVVVWVVFMRQMQTGGGKAMSFGKSRAKLLNENQNRVTFDDVAGVDEAKEELEEIIAFLKDPKKFTKLGGRIPKGVLLVGAPGTGKTLLARAIAGEAGVPFFSISGSDFVEMFVGVGASRVRDLFVQGKKNAPCIIFIDEIDAVGRHRGAGLGGGHDEREQTLNQLLVEMDGFETNEGVILIAATNRPDVLDPALLRPGRFDRRVVVPRPDVRGRLGILKVHTRSIPLAPDVDLEILARGTPGFSGADLESTVNEAALFAARYNKNHVDATDFDKAKDKVLMGAERRSMIISDEERRVTAFHEAGHALVAKLLPDTDPIHKVTIIPRGMALGTTQQLPIDEKHTYPKEYLLSQIAILYGGRAAEELILEEPTTGAGNDIERATELARSMVCEWGMSEKLGPLAFGKREEQVFLGRDLAYQKDFSEHTAQTIDGEIRRICTEGFEKARRLLSENVHLVRRVAEVLLERELLEGDEIDRIIRGEALAPFRDTSRTRPPHRPLAATDEPAPDLPGLAATLRNPKLVPES
ncbi:MAG: ATP-dependent zinc metalloprotease FtsH [bacterium]